MIYRLNLAAAFFVLVVGVFLCLGSLSIFLNALSAPEIIEAQTAAAILETVEAERGASQTATVEAGQTAVQEKTAVVAVAQTAFVTQLAVSTLRATAQPQQPLPLLTFQNAGRIVFERDGWIFTVNADGTEEINMGVGQSPAWVWFDKAQFIVSQSETGRLNLHRSGPIELPEVIQEYSHLNKAVAVSADGRMMAVSKGLSIVVSDLYGFYAEEYRLTLDILALAWSPDNESIVFFGKGKTIEQSGIYTFHLDDSHPEPVILNLREVYGLAWSPDGSQIAFSTVVDNGLNIYKIRPDGSHLMQLTDETTRDDAAPTWSPDGNYIAFVSNRFGQYDIFVMRADGTQQTPLVTGAGNEYHLVWQSALFLAQPMAAEAASNTNACHEIAFIRKGEAFVMNVCDGNERQLTKRPPSFQELAWTVDGNALLISNKNETYLVDMNGSISPTLLPFDISSMTVSPDGKLIAFVSYTGNIQITSVDGTNSRLFSETNATGSTLAWSSDGSKIVFGRGELYVVEVESGRLTRLTFDRLHNAYPSWSPSGSKIVFASRRDGDWEVYTINADGSGLAQLTTNDRDDIHPSWSPDGQHILYMSGWSSPNYDIVVMNADGSSPTPLTVQGEISGFSPPRWRPVPGVSIPSAETPALTVTPTIQLTP